MRIVCGPPWTLDGRWVVLGAWRGVGVECIVHDPNNAEGAKVPTLEGPPPMFSLLDIRDCVDFIRREEECQSTAS